MQGREIKFRIWDKDLKKMRVCGTDIHDSIAFDMDNNAVYYNMQNGCGSLADGTGTYDLMQFTGLCDKNSKEIYEGDVGEEDGVFYQVIWVDSGAMYGAKVIKTDFVLTRQLTFPLQQYIIEGTKVCNFEIIGNIYENPELLEVGN